jgi:GC-rich sequence DNA-binding factor
MLIFIQFTDQMERDAIILLEDVVEDFSALPKVMKRFEAWKKFDIDSYKEAYVHLALPKVFSPLIRLNLISWNPLEVMYFVLLHILAET